MSDRAPEAYFPPREPTPEEAASVLAGRAYVTPDDVRALAAVVLAHRLIMVPEAEGDPRARETVVQEAVAKVSYRRAVRPV